jgi:hypothetical protein
MPISRARLCLFLLAAAALAGCGGAGSGSSNSSAQPVHDVPAVRLNYKYEADVPAPSTVAPATAEERDAGVQSDFDNARTQEILDQTLASPDKKHVLAVYHRVTDAPSEFRLDMYSADGKLLRKMTSDAMAVHFPERIVWSPDSNSIAFVAMIRVAPQEPDVLPSPLPVEPEEGSASPAAAPTAPAPTGILAFRTEQLYIASADGSGVRPLTQNEGLIYFYYVWSPDSTMLAALASTAREWKFFEALALAKGEIYVPSGRPRLIEKNGRERRLDDNQTPILPVWSPDGTKVAVAFDVEINEGQSTVRKRRDTQIRVYDAVGTNPTQAAIPLRNQLLISSAAYDRNLHNVESSNSLPENAAPASPAAPIELSTLPDESELVSYNPIVAIAWPSNDLLYFETAYVKRMQRESDNVTSFARWHRLVFSAQPVSTAK